MLSALKASSLHQSSKNGLYAYIAQKGILKAEQGGFRKMHGTVGSIFTLKMLVDKYVKSKPHKHRNLLFSIASSTLEKPSTACIPQQKLFNKLIERRYLRTFLKRFNIHVLK